MSTCLVSVCLITYNHVNYIRQAVEGILMQRANFSFDIIIADDFSTDGTREILTEYKERFPNIQLILQKKNVGPGQNVIDLLNAPKSKYVAYLEGDDFWTDTHKLQKQVDFLDANPKICGCYHDVVVVDENGKLIKDTYYHADKEVLSQSDCLINGGSYCTGSLMFRSLALKNMPPWFMKSPSDYAIDLLITEFGDIAYLNENMGAYRIHQGGSWQGKLMHKNYEDVIKRFQICLTNPKFQKEYGNIINKRIGELAGSVALLYQKERKYFKKLKYIGYYIYYGRPKKKSDFNYLIGKLLFPSLYEKISLMFSKPTDDSKV